jgi:hypothetical protein
LVAAFGRSKSFAPLRYLCGQTCAQKDTQDFKDTNDEESANGIHDFVPVMA